MLSERLEFSRTFVHNTFSTPIISPAVGVCDRTFEEINQLEIKTCKFFTLYR